MHATHELNRTHHLPIIRLDSSVLQGVGQSLDLGTGVQAAGDIFHQDGGDVLGGEGLEDEERRFRDRAG